CDESSCQNPDHWLVGERLQNIVDYAARRGLTGHALADVRGAAGRAVAVRDAILAAAPGAESAAIAAALAAGHPSGEHQDTLWWGPFVAWTRWNVRGSAARFDRAPPWAICGMSTLCRAGGRGPSPGPREGLARERFTACPR